MTTHPSLQQQEQTITHPLITHIDHVGIQLQDPARLFAFCTEVLDLPVAFPFAKYPAYTTGSVVLGNAFLELTRFGAATPRAPAAHYHILGFLLQPGRLSDTLQELDRRDIPHSAAVPFFAPDATDANPRKLWTNVFLGGFLGDGFWRRLFFLLTKSATPKPSVQRSQLGRALSVSLLKRAFPNGFPALTEYHAQNDDAKRAADWDALRQRNGGALGIQHVQEVIVGIPGADPTASNWARLLAPLAPDDTGAWRLGRGPALRLAPQSPPAVQTLVLNVASLARAQRFIRETGLSAQPVRVGQEDRLALTLPHADGLTVQLTK